MGKEFLEIRPRAEEILEFVPCFGVTPGVCQQARAQLAECGVAVSPRIGGIEPFERSCRLAQSVFVGGLAMLASFGASVWLSRRVTAAVEQGFSTGAAGLILVKLPVLIIVLWGLFDRFDVLGVVLGGCVMVSAVVIDAVRIGDKSMVGAT